ncbi:MAG: AarF/UbiB family protein [Microbacteriaceae bacterium]
MTGENPRKRYRKILRFASAHLAVTWWYEIFLPRIGLAKLAKRSRIKRMRRIAQRFYVLAVDLGGLMIKVGQYMSSRLDVLPPEITAELEGLQDEVPPVPFAAIRALAEAEFGVPLEAVFASIDENPVAAASLGQTHRARLSALDAEITGLDSVVIKVQRPNIQEIVSIDLEALRKVGGWLSRIRIVSNRVDAPALVEEFAQISLDEIDYFKEAANAERFAQNFADDDRVSVPTVVWERTTRRVLTLEDVTAIKITDMDALRDTGIDPIQLAPVFAEIMFEQLFIHGFFHADPHPGNIFVTPSSVEATGHPWKLTFIDFGMMGEIPVSTRTGLRKFLIAAALRDGRALIQAMRELGVLLPSAETVELERAVTKLFARFGGMGFAELREVDAREFYDFAVEFGDMVRSLPFQMPEHFLLIIRSSSLTSGVCSTLNPKFNLWDSVEPYAEQLLKNESGNTVKDFAKQAFDVAGMALRLPKRLDDLVSKFEDGSVAVHTPDLSRRLKRLERTMRRQMSAILFGALFVAGAILWTSDTLLGMIVMGVSGLPLMHTLFAGFWRR